MHRTGITDRCIQTSELVSTSKCLAPATSPWTGRALSKQYRPLNSLFVSLWRKLDRQSVRTVQWALVRLLIWVRNMGNACVSALTKPTVMWKTNAAMFCNQLVCCVYIGRSIDMHTHKYKNKYEQVNHAWPDIYTTYSSFVLDRRSTW